MLSIGAMGSGQEGYYLALATEDYYLAGGEPLGVWLGRGAEALGLKGHVGAVELQGLFQGKSPRGDSDLVQRHPRRQPGWDLTFSAPKSVSVAWSQAGYELREALQAAHAKAVRFAIGYLEENAAFTRRGKGGVRLERCGLAVAAFEHGTSRAQDPQLHTHALVLNVGTRGDGTFGTVVSQDFYDNKMLLGALYRTELANECLKLGFALRRGEHTFELASVPPALTKHFSTRRTEIEDALAREGLSGPVASSLAALSTRAVKGHLPREELMRAWRAVGERHGFSERELLAACHPRSHENQRALRLAVGKAMHDLAGHQGSFTKADVLRRAANALQHTGVSGGAIVSHVHAVMHEGGFVCVSGMGHQPRFASAELLRLERQILAHVEASKGRTEHQVGEDVLREVVRGRTLSQEQEAALRHIAVAPGSIQCVEGMAGTGKTYMLSAAREAWEKAGFRVVGTAVAARAALELQNGGGIESYSIAKVLQALEAGDTAQPRTSSSSPEPKELLRRTASPLQTDDLDAKRVQLHVRLAASGASWRPSNSDLVAEKLATEAHKKPWAPASHFEAHQAALIKEHVRLAALGVEWRPELGEVTPEKMDATASAKAKRGSLDVTKKQPPTLDAKTVLIVDEAGMVGTREMARLQHLASSAGAKVVLVGDQRQLQSIDGGSPFRLCMEHLGSARLEHIMRQREDWMVNAVHQFADGDARGALSQYALHDKLTLAPTREAAAKTLVAEWAEQRTSDLRQTLILAGTRAETRAINVLAQEERREQGELSSRSITVGGQRFSEGDRVCFTKNNKALGVCNGDFGVLESIRGVISSPVTPLTVRLDRPDTKGDPVRVRFTPVSNPTLDLGYAVTTHKAQGATVDRTFVLAGGWMQDRELSYVQMSRHREACHIYSSVGDAGDDTGSLVRSMARSRMHGMVLDTMREPERESSR